MKKAFLDITRDTLIPESVRLMGSNIFDVYIMVSIIEDNQINVFHEPDPDSTEIMEAFEEEHFDQYGSD